MSGPDFSDKQKKSVQAFSAQTRESISKDRVSPEVLLYMVAAYNEDDKLCKAVRLLTKEIMERRKHKQRSIYLDLIVRKTLKNKPKPKFRVISKSEKEVEKVKKLKNDESIQKKKNRVTAFLKKKIKPKSDYKTREEQERKFDYSDEEEEVVMKPKRHRIKLKKHSKE